MRLLLAGFVLMAPIASVAQAPAPANVAGPGVGEMTPNLWPTEQRCLSLPRQAGAESKRNSGAHRLNEEPPARAYLTVDRQVNGCRELTRISGQPGAKN